MARKTEIIVGAKPVPTKGLMLIHTESGQQLFVSDKAYNENAETVTYETHAAGSTFIATRDSSRTMPNPDPTTAGATPFVPLYRKGQSVVRQKDSVEFVCFGAKQVVKKYSALELIDHMIAKGITPAFNLATA